MGSAGPSGRLKAHLRELRPLLHLEEKDIEAILDTGIRETKESFAAMRVGLNELRLRAESRTALDALRGPKQAILAAAADESLAQTPQHVSRETCALLEMLGVSVPGVPRDVDVLREVEPLAQTSVEGPELDSGLPEGPSEKTLATLTQEACSLLESKLDFDLTTFVLTVLEAIYRGIGFDRVLFGFVNPDRTYIEGRLGLGDDIDNLIERFRFRISMSGGPVSAAFLCKRTIVADADAGQHADIARLFGCSYLVLHPIVGAGVLVGCLYMESRGSRRGLTQREFKLLEQLRDAVAEALERQRRA
jgi:hypothetical protein